MSLYVKVWIFHGKLHDLWCMSLTSGSVGVQNCLRIYSVSTKHKLNDISNDMAWPLDTNNDSTDKKWGYIFSKLAHCKIICTDFYTLMFMSILITAMGYCPIQCISSPFYCGTTWNLHPWSFNLFRVLINIAFF